jgi:hypothetical protein
LWTLAFLQVTPIFRVVYEVAFLQLKMIKALTIAMVTELTLPELPQEQHMA